MSGERGPDAGTAVEERPAVGSPDPPGADLRALALRLQEIREEERKELAHEIHDVLGQELTMLKLDVVRLLGRRRARKSAPDGPRPEDLVERIDRLMGTVRRISSDLRPPVLDYAGLECRTLVLSIHADGQLVVRALGEGASGYLTKDCAPTELVVLERLGAGKTVSEIAVEPGLSVKTVGSCRTRILGNPDLRTMAQLVAYALRSGIAPGGAPSRKTNTDTEWRFHPKASREKGRQTESGRKATFGHREDGRPRSAARGPRTDRREENRHVDVPGPRHRRQALGAATDRDRARRDGLPRRDVPRRPGGTREGVRPGAHAVLLDLRMPWIDGLEVLRRIREGDALSEAPGLVVSSADERPARIDAIRADAILSAAAELATSDAASAAAVRELAGSFDHEGLLALLGGASPSE